MKGIESYKDCDSRDFRNNKVFAEKNGRDVIYLRTKR